MNVIFLDIDYVLNGISTKEKIQGIRGIDDDKVILLKQLVEQTNAIIVLTSSWRNDWDNTLENIPPSAWPENSRYNYGRYINMKLAKQGLTLADKTGDLHWTQRALEIIDWLSRHKVDNFVILDDNDFDWKRHGLINHWVDTYDHDGQEWLHGLTLEHIQKAQEILSTKKGENL